ncbi:MAG: hypothetical protein E7022_06330 [Desulfovibrio desulfuricans]|nr:hypothetical protein [Desulfovibrio desulfuricans]
MRQPRSFYGLPVPLPGVPTALILLLLLAVLCACTPRGGAHRPRSAVPAVHAPQGLPRVDPGYLQWLERQSMLGGAQELTGQVSGTERLWRNSATARRVPLLLSAAPHWLDVNPHDVAAGQPCLRALARPAFLTFMQQAGFGGLFLAPTGETGDIWSGDAGAAPVPDAEGTGGENVVSLRPAPALGDEKDFSSLIDALEKAQLQLGGDLPPAATGLGPDFMLQARSASRFDGLYAMLPVPQKDWDLLPAASGEWDCLPLREHAVQALRRRGALPGPLWRDALPWATPGGWAVTGEVRGADGQTRRWAYRYSGNALRPVLLWQDPSAQARRVWSAAVIRHTGLQRQTLAGLRLEALMGLDARPDDAAAEAVPADNATAPGQEALNALAGEIRRYGGWTMQDDVLPPSLTRAVLDAGVDFARDSSTPTAAAYALLSGDAAPLAALLKASLAAGVDHSRLARGVRERHYVDWRPLLGLPDGRELARNAQRLAGGPPDAAGVRATAATLAARALGLDHARALAPEHQADMRATCLLLLGWRMGLPGLTFLSPQDIAGTLTPPGQGKPDAAPLWEESPTPGGKTAAPSVFGPLDAQWAQDDSFARQTARVLHARHAAGLAEGRLVQIFVGPPGCAAALSALPHGGYWLLAANFSGKPQRMTCPLPPDAARTGRDVADGRALPADGRSLTVELEARRARHVLLGGPKTHGETP